MSEWSEGEAFGELRSLVSRRPGADAFARICELVDEAEAAAPGLYSERWHGYLSSHLGGWQPRQCSVRLTRRAEALQVAAAPWSELVKGVDLVSFDLSRVEDVAWVAGELREAFPMLEHLGLWNTSIRKAAIAKACEEGVFDGLSSLSFDDCGLHPSTLNVLLETLEERAEVEHLRFAHCSMGRAQFERIIETSLASNLRSLGLPDHAKFNASQAKSLAARAPEFARIERLDLRNCSVAGAGAKALAEAEWGGPLEHIGLHRNGIRGMGVKALAERGLLGSLVEEGGEKTLDLTSQQIGNRALQIVFDSGVLEGVENLRLFDCNLTTLESFEDAQALTHLRALEVGGAWGEKEDGAVLLGAIEGMERLESLSLMRRGLSDDFVERLCANPGAQRLDELVFDYYATCQARDVEAMLDWDRFPELDRLVMDATVPAGHAIIERAMATGRFSKRSSYGDVVILSVDPYYEEDA